MIDLTFVGTGTFSRLPEVLKRSGVRIRVIGNAENALAGSEFVDEFIHLDYATPTDLAPALLAEPALLDSLSGWIVFGEDTTPRLLARSGLPFASKARILPARTAEGLGMLGSKAGLATLQGQVGRGGPRSVVASTNGELAAVLGTWEGNSLVKSDGGAGGEQVVAHRPERSATPTALPDAWFPVVVQEYIAGVDVSIEVLLRDGRLAGWQYSVARRVAGRYGPTTVRRFVDPPRLDFIHDLDDLATAGGLHGFFNCSLRWSPREGRHYLFELDPRPNAWHQFGPRLGVDWLSAMSQPAGAACRSPRLPHPGVVLHLYPRELLWGLDNEDWHSLLPWLLVDPGTWFSRNRRDARVNEADRRALSASAQRQLRMGVARALGTGWNAMPRPLQSAAERFGLRNAVGRSLGTQ